MATMKQRISDKIVAAFAPQSFTISDDSHLHAGHIGHPGSGHPGTMSADETHFTVTIVSQAFAGKSRVQRHRMVNDLLADELKGGLHALAIRALTPED